MEQHLKLACFLAFLLLVLCCFLRGAAHGSPLDCESIQDADQRNACRAVGSERQELLRVHQGPGP